MTENPHRSHGGDKPAPPGENFRVEGRRGNFRAPRENAPLVLEITGNDDYDLPDSGDGQKPERYGAYRIVRPEGQAIRNRALGEKEWSRADAVFTGDADEEGIGRWRFPKSPFGETWPMRHDGPDYLGRFTSFRHVGVFPEQAIHWNHMESLVKIATGSVRVLNPFGYTGTAAPVAAGAGAEVTHVDASRKVIGRARENQMAAGPAAKAIGWICGDALKFARRERRREKTCDIVLLDPPAFGRGPKGGKWRPFENIREMIALCSNILTPGPLAAILTAYSIRASFFTTRALMPDAFARMGGVVESGELVIRERSDGRALATSLFSRRVADR